MPNALDATTLGQAIADVRGYVDDKRGRRWDRDGVKRALWGAISSCVEEYAGRHGGDRFDEEIDVSTTAATGAVSLLEHDPLDIRAVLIAESTSGPWNVALEPADPKIRGALDTSARNLRLRIVRRPPLPVADSDLLVGVMNGSMRSWPAFDRWVCMRAALALGITEEEPRAALVMQEQEQRALVTPTRKLPSGLPWPRARRANGWSDLRWLFNQRTATLSLHLTNVAGW